MYANLWVRTLARSSVPVQIGQAPIWLRIFPINQNELADLLNLLRVEIGAEFIRKAYALGAIRNRKPDLDQLMVAQRAIGFRQQ